MFKRMVLTGLIALSATSIALAGPGGTKGKPDKGDDEPPGAIEVGFTWIDRKDGYLFGLSATNGTNYRLVAEGTQISYLSLEDIAPSAAGNLAILDDFGSLVLVDWSYNASGGISAADSTVFYAREQAGGASCARFSQDGNTIYFTTTGTTLWSVPTADPLASPTSEYSLGADERFVLCAPDIDGSVVAAVVRIRPDGGHEGYRLADFTLGAGADETEILGYDPDLIIVSVDVGSEGSLAYSYRDGDVYENETAYQVDGQTRILQNAYHVRYDCGETRLLYQSRHPRSGARNWLIRNLGTGLTSDYPERRETRSADWVC